MADDPAESQAHTAWSLGSFYIGEERVTADLAPFLLAAPSGEVELFLATQLVDEARHTAFFDRFGGEVMALSADDLRGRMRELEADDDPRRGTRPSTTACARPRIGSRRSRTTSTCSSRGSAPTT